MAVFEGKSHQMITDEIVASDVPQLYLLILLYPTHHLTSSPLIFLAQKCLLPLLPLTQPTPLSFSPFCLFLVSPDK